MDPKSHWETIYRTKDVHEVSWFQAEARPGGAEQSFLYCLCRRE